MLFHALQKAKRLPAEYTDRSREAKRSRNGNHQLSEKIRISLSE